MRTLSLSTIRLIILISLLLVFAGHTFVLQRTAVNKLEEMTIRGDTNAYVSMIKGNWTTVSSPFKFRILVPFVARLLPVSPTDALRIISYLSLFFFYVFTLLTCAKIGINIGSSAFGLVLIWASTWHLYGYHNPFLTDAFALFMLCLMIYSLLNNHFSIFLSAALLGILTRETSIFLVPIWLVKKEWRRSISLIAISFLVLSIPRYFLASETDPTLVSVFFSIGKLQKLLLFGKEVFLSWGWIWGLSIIGMWYLPNDTFLLISTAYLSLLSCAILTSLIATDTGRMFSILSPIFAITSAQLYAKIINMKMYRTAFAFVMLVILQAIVSFPNVFLDRDLISAFHLQRNILLGIEVVFVLFVFITLHKSLHQEVIGKMAYVFDNLQNRSGIMNETRRRTSR